MVDIGSLFGDENEDFRNKAKVSILHLHAVRGRDREVLHQGRLVGIGSRGTST